jgi:hypothetical protein
LIGFLDAFKAIPVPSPACDRVRGRVGVGALSAVGLA